MGRGQSPHMGEVLPAIAGQATMATKMRATRISCIADSFRKDSWLWPGIYEPVSDINFLVTSDFRLIGNQLRITNLHHLRHKSIEKCL
jgi:hypothetical protein